MMHDTHTIASVALHGQLWALRMFGNVTVASALLFAWSRDQRFISAKEVAEIADTSEDTVRRTVQPLVRLGRIRQMIEGRTKLYRMNDELAEKAIQNISRRVVP